MIVRATTGQRPRERNQEVREKNDSDDDAADQTGAKDEGNK